MYTQHPTLLIGPSDWDEGRAPRAQFEHRIAALWDAFPDASQAIVFGSAASHAELAYLTHFVPKLEPGIALISRDGGRRLLFGGGPNMVGAMKPLTFITDLAPLSALAKSIGGWRSPLLIGGGAMTAAMRKIIDEATGGTAHNATAWLQTVMRHKSSDEHAAIREACRCLTTAMAAIRHSALRHDSATAALLAGERAAADAGAQDIRTLVSLDAGRTLRPFETLDPRTADPLQVYVAVRRFNYWAEGFDCIANAPPAPAAAAAAMLDRAIAAIAPGVTLARLSGLLAPARPYRDHAVTTGAAVATMGLSLREPPPLTCEAGDVMSVRAGLTDGDRHAIVSAMVAVRANGAERLWCAGMAWGGSSEVRN